MVPALAVVHGDTGACLAAEMPLLTHTGWGLRSTAVALSLCGICFCTSPLAETQLPRGHLLPQFSRGALCREDSPPALKSALNPA
jgi:hypothetical protein